MSTDFPTAVVGSSQAPTTTVEKSFSASNTKIRTSPYLFYDGRTDNANSSFKDTIRTAASYDFGFAKLGGGLSVLTTTGGSTLTDSMIAVSVPVGAMTLGANFAQETSAGTIAQASLGVGAGDLDQTRSGYGLSATYALSKRTSLIANYANWLSAAGKDRSSETNLLLSHSF